MEQYLIFLSEIFLQGELEDSFGSCKTLVDFGARGGETNLRVRP